MCSVIDTQYSAIIQPPIYAIMPTISGASLIFVAAYGKVTRKLLEKVALKYHRDTRQQRRIDRMLLE